MKRSMMLASLCALLLFPASRGFATEAPPTEVPVKGMVTMVDIGADKCIPCKLMAPILQKLSKEYEGRAAIVFLDVWKDKSHGPRFGIQAIPTQIFYDKDGKEIFRHTGYFAEKDIVEQLKKMGVN